MELGIYTFADVAPEAVSGRAVNTHQRIKDLLEEIRLADQVGLDVFAVGEHHRPDYAVSAPAVVLGAAAVLTNALSRLWTSIATPPGMPARRILSSESTPMRMSLTSRSRRATNFSLPAAL